MPYKVKPDPVKGVFYKILSAFCFALINVSIKHITCDTGCKLPFVQVAFLQNFFAGLLILPFIVKKGVSFLRPRNVGLNIIRIVCAATGVAFWYWSMSLIPVSQVVALSFMSPIIAMLGSKFILKEKFNPMLLLTITIAFIGSVIITKPYKAISDISINNYALFLPMISATAFALVKIFTKKLIDKGESPQLLTAYIMLFVAPVLFIPAIKVWQEITLYQFGFILLIAVLSNFAYISVNNAYKYSAVNFLQPLGFARLLFSSLLGMIIFNDTISNNTILIGAFVMSMNLLLLNFEAIKVRFVNNGNTA